MKVDIQKDEEKVTDGTTELPAEEAVADEVVIDPQEELAEKLRLAELDKARLEGEIRGRIAVAPAQVNQDEQVKQQVWADANGLNDEEFEAKWKTPKYKATTALLQADLDKTRTKNTQEMAEMRAEQRLAMQYGKDFYEAKTEVDEMVAMASLEVRQNPEKLAKFMEKAFLAVQKDKPVAAKAGASVNRSKIASGFEKPQPKGERIEKVADTDEVAAEYREIGRAFGIESEKERKTLMESDHISMDLGNGMTLTGRTLKKNVAA